MPPDQLAQGMDPDEVGPVVLDTVQDDRFWVLTHPDMGRYVERQVEAMVTDRSLPRALMSRVMYAISWERQRR